MGHHLHKLGSSPSGEEWMLFAAVDHWNSGGEAENVRFVIEKNMEVGKIAVEMVACDSASIHLQRAKDLLLRDKNVWKDNYKLCLHAWEMLGEVELCRGNLEEGKKTSEEVFMHAKTTSDKLFMKIALSKALGRAGNHAGAAQLCRTTLRNLQACSSSKFGMCTRLTRDLLFVNRQFSRLSDDDILSPPLLTDKTEIMTMGLLASLSQHGFAGGDMMGCLAGNLRQLAVSFASGLCKTTTTALAQCSLVCDAFGDLDRASRATQLAVQMHVKTDASELECHPIFPQLHWFRSWDTTAQDLSGQFARGASVGMRAGETEIAFFVALSGCMHECVSGCSLGVAETKTSQLIEKLDLCKIDSVKEIAVETLLPMQHLRGTALVPRDYEDLPKTAPVTGQGPKHGHVARLQIGFCFGNLSFCKAVMEKLVEIPDDDKSHAHPCLRHTFVALVSASLFQQNGKRSDVLRARRNHKKLLQLSKQKGMNSWHRVLLMKAHIHAAACRKRKNLDRSLELHDQAVKAATTHGCVQDAALGCQSSVEFRLRKQAEGTLSDQDGHVTMLLSKTRKLHKEWGAKALVRDLESKFNKHFVFSDDSTSGDCGSLMTSDCEVENSHGIRQ